MRERRSALSLTTAGRLIRLLVAVMALGGQVAVGSRVADRLASSPGGAASGPSPLLWGARQQAQRLARTPPGDPSTRPLLGPIAAAGDAPELLTPTRTALPCPVPAPGSAAGANLAAADARQENRVRPYPRGPPIRG